ncbi:MAG: deoxyribodipyrimidine photolyase [Planctomycetota bacterium]
MRLEPRVPAERIVARNSAPVAPRRRTVLYWMTAHRRATWNFALERAVEWCRSLKRPLLVFEPLRIGYRWASARHHQFVIDGMRDHCASFAAAGVGYYPYVEPRAGAGAGLLAALARDACVVVTDDYPCFFLPRMLESASRRLDVLLEAVDSNGFVPMRAAAREFTAAVHFRRYVQKRLLERMEVLPLATPLDELPKQVGCEVADDVQTRWPRAADRLLAGDPAALRALAIDQSVAPTIVEGGAVAAHALHDTFFQHRFAGYATERSDPSEQHASELSPHIHFGHVATHEIIARVFERERWRPEHLVRAQLGKREGFWGMSADAEALLDQLIVWRELGFNACAERSDHESLSALPRWAQTTLAEHAADPRPEQYELAAFERAETHDELWNATQRQLVREGRIQNYLRMVWGKKILEWSATPARALAIMIELNNKYALDGRDPNSYNGILWVLGRFDRPWAPTRAVFGCVRYMSTANSQRKFRLKDYLARYAASAPDPTRCDRLRTGLRATSND